MVKKYNKTRKKKIKNKLFYIKGTHLNPLIIYNRKSSLRVSFFKQNILPYALLK